MPTRGERLKATRDNLLQIIEEQTAAWVEAGCPPTFSVDGESFSWEGWLGSKLESVEKLNKLILRANPYYKTSRHRG